MSLALFNAVPVGAIETLFDRDGNPKFKRADLGRYLRIAKIAESYRDMATTPRHELGLVSNQSLKPGQNSHDVFVSLDSALEIVVRSKKPRAVALVKWLTRKGVEKVHEEHQLAITERDNQIQAIQYENVALQAQRDVYHAQVNDLITNRHVPRSGDIDTVLVAIEKNHPDEVHPFYMLRCQRMQVNKRLSVLRAKYPQMEVLESECDDANAIHAWNRFKRRILTKESYYCNHFTLPEDTIELFEVLFNVQL